jgi:hypothetical protein
VGSSSNKHPRFCAVAVWGSVCWQKVFILCVFLGGSGLWAAASTSSLSVSEQPAHKGAHPGRGGGGGVRLAPCLHLRSCPVLQPSGVGGRGQAVGSSIGKQVGPTACVCLHLRSLQRALASQSTSYRL